MPILTLAHAGTAQPFAVSTDYIVNGLVLPSKRFAREVDIRVLTAGATVYIGKQKPLGVGSGVSSSTYDIKLDDQFPTIPIGYASEENDVDLGGTYWDASADNVQIVIAPETT